MRRFCLYLLFACIFSSPAHSQDPVSTDSPEDGDIVFQTLPCGGLCDAIIATTPCTATERFNHCGIVYKRRDSLFVIEAIGVAVQETPIEKFLARDSSAMLTCGRVLGNARIKRNAVLDALRYIGRPYDDAFLPGDSALYCSELVYEVFYESPSWLGIRPVFTLTPMTFRPSPAAPTHPAWISYYQGIRSPVPEGQPGINPCAIAASPKVRLYKVPRQKF